LKMARRSPRKKPKSAASSKGRGRIRVSPKEARTVDGIVFDSKLEKELYQVIKNLVPPEELQLQPNFLIMEGFRDLRGRKYRSISYSADFLLGPPRVGDTDPILPNQLVLDAKGMLTDVYRIKRKLFADRYGVDILELKRPAHVVDVVKYYERLKC